ncbi:Pol polyprotein [Plakobranchus ocellatus]|uniref:Pol polyprotein n=1 Tax=Plakobranchus ocellatus TaxID=259542 RepID=A0AAV4C5M2_9GAST|nr:Pol polyprotein [Plakobranchus ocellatus]
MAGLEPATERFLQISGRTHEPLCHRRPGSMRKKMIMSIKIKSQRQRHRISNKHKAIRLCRLMGYWQVPLSENSKAITAFPTELGLMQVKVMPFWLQCAPAAFSKLKRRVLKDVPNVKNYIDDIAFHNSTWGKSLEESEDNFK